MTNTIKAIFLDVDGTILSFQTHLVPDSAREALLRAHERGVRLFIATGRALTDLEPVAGIPYDGVVALNGSECAMRDGRMIVRHLIPKADFERALELSEELDFPLALELNDGIFVNRVTPAVEQMAELIAHPVPQVADLRVLFERGDCCQMCFYFDADTQARVMGQLPTLAASRWCPLFADINVVGVDKATGLARFADHFGFELGEVMAFGDGGNDVAMLLSAGVGVAMGNACEDALRAADYVTASVDDDGLRKALEYYRII